MAARGWAPSPVFSREVTVRFDVRFPSRFEMLYLPGRTGRGDATAGVTITSTVVSIGSSSSSSGEMVSSDCA
jgi:hypothetical protein